MKPPKNTYSLLSELLSEPTPKLRTMIRKARIIMAGAQRLATECETELKRRRKAGPQLGMSARKRTQQKKGAS
jgi:hypothetical protein